MRPFSSPLLSLACVCGLAVLTAGILSAQGSGGPVLREQTVYVPFDKLEAVFEKEGRGIFLPYDEFLQLWQAAQPDPTPPPPDVPPADAVVRGGSYQGKVEDDIARLEVTFGLEALKKGWSELQLPLRNVAVESVTLRRLEPATGSAEALLSTRRNGYSVYLPEPGKYEAHLVFSVRVAQEPGKKTLRFGIPRAAVSRLELTIPESDVRVDVEPSLAVERTRVTTGAEASTLVEAFLGNSSEVAISWTPTLGRAGEGGAIVSAEQAVRTYLGERRLTIGTSVAYEILRGEADTFRVRVPENTRVISVEGENIREWNQEEVDGQQRVSVRLHSAVKKSYALALSFERILEATPETLAVPFPQAEDVFRESGYVVLDHDQGLNVRVTQSQRLSQLDPEDVPENLRSPHGVGFRYLAQGPSLELAVEKILPVVRSATTSVVTLGREEDSWVGWIDYEISKSGIFRLDFRVPSSWTVVSVGNPNDASDTVEEFQTQDADGKRTISVSLKSKALGSFRLPFRLSRDGSAGESGLAAGELTVSPPEVLRSTQDRGLFGISAPRAIEVRTLERTSLLDADESEILGSGIMSQLSSSTGLPRAYRYREQPASLRLGLEQKRTEIDVLAQHLVEVTDGAIRLTHLLDYEILYAEVDRLRFQAPSSLDDRLKVDAKHKTEVRKVPGENGLTLWEVTLTPAAKGLVSLTLTHTQELKGLETGVPFPYATPMIHAPEADVRNETGFVAIRKEGTLEIASEPVDMDAIDTTELPAKLRRGQIYSAFRYFGSAPSLALRLTRHEYQRLADASIQHIHMESVLTRERKLQTKATLWVQNSGRQYLELQLRPEYIITLAVGSKTQSPKKAKTGDATLVEIPPSQGAGAFVLVSLFFEEPIAESAMGSFGRATLSTPQVLDGVPVSQVALDLYLPPEYAYLGWGGNLKPLGAYDVPVWTRFKRLLDLSPGYSQGGQHQTQAAGGVPLTIAQRNALAAQQSPIQIALPTEGFVKHSFHTLAPVGSLTFSYAGRRLFSLVDFFGFVLAAWIAYRLLVRKPWPRLQLGLLLMGVPLVLSWFTRAPLTEVFTSLCFGSTIVCLGFVYLPQRDRWRDHRATRLALAPDPFLEEAAPPAAKSPDIAPTGSDGPEKKDAEHKGTGTNDAGKKEEN